MNANLAETIPFVCIGVNSRWNLAVKQGSPMDANGRELILKKEVFDVVGCAFEVINVRGHGLHEKVYENCMCVEFRLRGIPYVQQPRHDVLYKGELVGEYIPDLIAFGKLIVDAKTIERITDHERGQMLNYLRITRLEVGLLLNFKRSRLEWERLVLTASEQAES